MNIGRTVALSCSFANHRSLSRFKGHTLLVWSNVWRDPMLPLVLSPSPLYRKTNGYFNTNVSFPHLIIYNCQQRALQGRAITSIAFAQIWCFTSSAKKTARPYWLRHIIVTIAHSWNTFEWRMFPSMFCYLVHFSRQLYCFHGENVNKLEIRTVK
jgi:hypothetical protein